MKFEGRCVAVAFALYLVFQLHATVFHGYWGQDWISHKVSIRLAALDPWDFFARYGPDRTNPPLYHGLAALLRRALGPTRYLPAVGLMNVAFGFAGMCVAYAVIRRLIASPVLRVAAIVFLLFLPFAMIHAQVIASDALATPLFWVLLWVVLGFRGDAPPLSLGWRVSLIAVLLMAGILTKFTFGSCIVATVVWAGLLRRTQVVTVRRLCVVLAVATAVPALFAYRESARFRAVRDPFGITVPKSLAEAAMNPRSILGPRRADVDVFSAPAYNWLRDGTYQLLVSNRHSFPALLHLAVFTDLLNVYQHDPYDQYFGRRTESNHRRMKIAVRTAVPFSILAVVAVTVLFARSAAAVVVRRDPRAIPLLTVLVFCIAWFVNVVGGFPFLSAAYSAGYWLPRLTAPALFGFFIAGFVLLDRLRWKSPRLHAVVLAAVVAQSALHASFLWPSASDGEIHEFNDDVAAAAASAGAVFRVASWQDGYQANRHGYYCLEKAIGIVVDRAGGTRNGWTLRFDVAPGRSSPLARGTLRVSSPLTEPRTIDYAGWSTPVAVELPLARGRSEIRVELASPAPTETADDLLVCMAVISGIELVGRDGTQATRLLR